MRRLVFVSLLAFAVFAIAQDSGYQPSAPPLPSYYSRPTAGSQFSGVSNWNIPGLNRFGNLGSFSDNRVHHSRFFNASSFFSRSHFFGANGLFGPLSANSLSISRLRWGGAHVGTTASPRFGLMGMNNAGVPQRRFFGSGTPGFDFAPSGHPFSGFQSAPAVSPGR